MSPLPEVGRPLVLRTPRRKTLGLGLLCAALTAASAFTALDGGLTGAVGVFGVVFFGLGGAYAMGKQLRRVPVLTLAADGVRPGSGGLVPWADVAGFGLTALGSTRCLGLSLRDATRYLASLTPEQARAARAFGLGGRLAAPLLGAADPTNLGEAARLASLPHRDLAAMLAWARIQSGGYELTWPSLLFDKPLEAVATECAAYHARAVGY